MDVGGDDSAAHALGSWGVDPLAAILARTASIQLSARSVTWPPPACTVTRAEGADASADRSLSSHKACWQQPYFVGKLCA